MDSPRLQIEHGCVIFELAVGSLKELGLAALGFVATGSEQRCESRGWIVGVLVAREEVVLVDGQLVSEEVADKELLAASKFRLSGEQVVRKRS